MLRQDHHMLNPTFRVFVTVTDFVSVQRVLVMLIGRNHRITRYVAEEAGGRWCLTIDSAAKEQEEVRLLETRLRRLPSVLDVQLGCGHSFAVPE